MRRLRGLKARMTGLLLAAALLGPVSSWASRHEILGSANLTTTVHFSPALDFNILADFEYHGLIGSLVQLGFVLDTALYPMSGSYSLTPQAAISFNFGGSGLNSQFFLRAMAGPTLDVNAATGLAVQVISTSLAFGKRFQMFTNVSYAPSLKTVVPIYLAGGIGAPYLVLELLAFSIVF